MLPRAAFKYGFWLNLVLALLPAVTMADSTAPASAGEAATVEYLDQEPILGSPAIPDAENLPTSLIEPTATTPVQPEQPVRREDLWQRIRDGFGMNNLQSPFTATHESWYAARPDYVQRMVDRGQRYLYHVVDEVQKRGMPTEIALLPMIESAFNPTAYSSAKASGIWQFVPSTGKNFGLRQDWWQDNRRDVTAATDAALNYLQKLHVMFGTWELALAAYNAGEGTVQKAIERNRRKGLPTDYQSLRLPAETSNYVPKLQAVKNIIANPKQYGLSLKSIEDKPYFTSVPVTAKMDVNVAAKLAGVSVEEFKQLNPAYNRPVINGNSQSILLPVGREEDFAANLANYNRPLVSWTTHYARRGEKVSAIAKKYGISVGQLMDINDLSRKQRLKADQPILVPAGAIPPGNSLPSQVAMASTPLAGDKVPRQQTTLHTVRPGDTVSSIAKKYGISSRQLMSLNKLKKSRLKNGQVLTVTSPLPSAQPNTKLAASEKRLAKSATIKTQYVVKRGDTLASIARKFNIAVSDLQRWNKASGNRPKPGTRLVLYKAESA